jgi:hypothetical protein
MQYLLCVVYFGVWGTTKEVFVVDVMDVTLANCRIFMWQHAHDAEVTPMQYRRANGIPSPFNSDTNSP